MWLIIIIWLREDNCLLILTYCQCLAFIRITKNWVKWLKPLLFAASEIPQTTTEFSLFELLCYCKPHDVIKFIMENWEKEPLVASLLLTWEHPLSHLTQENFLLAQKCQSYLYNRHYCQQEFRPQYIKCSFLLATCGFCGPGDGNSGSVLRSWDWILVQKVWPFFSSSSNHLLLPQNAQDSKSIFQILFLPLICHTNLIEQHIETSPGVVVFARKIRLSGNTKLCQTKGETRNI